MAVPGRPTSSTSGPPPPAGEALAVHLVLEGAVAPADVPVLLARVRKAVAGVRASIVACDVERLGPPDIETVDALARLALAIRRSGCRMELEHASPQLRDLVGLAGLARVLPCARLPLEALGESEEREEPGRVEEERHADDPAL